MLFACNTTETNLIVKGALYPFFYKNNESMKIYFYFEKNCNIPNYNENLKIVIKNKLFIRVLLMLMKILPRIQGKMRELYLPIIHI